MPNNQNYFHDQHDNEELIGFFRKHWSSLAPATFRFIISSSFLIVALFIARYLVFHHNVSVPLYRSVLLIIFIYGSYELHKYLLAILSWFLTVVIITDFRVVEVIKTIYLQDDKEAVDLKKVQDIQMKKNGFLRNFLDYGRIYLTLASILDAKEIRHVPNVSEWLKKMNEVRRNTIFGKPQTSLQTNPEISQVQKFIESEIITDLKE